jgi:hypothetical protein
VDRLVGSVYNHQPNTIYWWWGSVRKQLYEPNIYKTSLPKYVAYPDSSVTFEMKQIHPQICSTVEEALGCPVTLEVCSDWWAWVITNHLLDWIF